MRLSIKDLCKDRKASEYFTNLIQTSHSIFGSSTQSVRQTFHVSTLERPSTNMYERDPELFYQFEFTPLSETSLNTVNPNKMIIDKRSVEYAFKQVKQLADGCYGVTLSQFTVFINGWSASGVGTIIVDSFFNFFKTRRQEGKQSLYLKFDSSKQLISVKVEECLNDKSRTIFVAHDLKPTDTLILQQKEKTDLEKLQEQEEKEQEDAKKFEF